MQPLFKVEDVAVRWCKARRFVLNRTSRLWTRRHKQPRLAFIRIGKKLFFREADILEYEQRFVKGPSKNEAPS